MERLPGPGAVAPKIAGGVRLVLSLPKEQSRFPDSLQLRYITPSPLQVVALDADGAAEGDLYMDDGSSFAFQRGAQLHRRFRFAGGKLSSSSADTARGAALTLPLSGEPFKTDVVVERIVVLGLTGGSAAWKVLHHSLVVSFASGVEHAQHLGGCFLLDNCTVMPDRRLGSVHSSSYHRLSTHARVGRNLAGGARRQRCY